MRVYQGPTIEVEKTTFCPGCGSNMEPGSGEEMR